MEDPFELKFKTRRRAEPGGGNSRRRHGGERHKSRSRDSQREGGALPFSRRPPPCPLGLLLSGQSSGHRLGTLSDFSYFKQ